MTEAALPAPVLTVSPSKYHFDVGDFLQIDCDAPLPACAEAKFQIYRKENFYTSVEADYKNIGFKSVTTADTGKAGGYSCDYTYTGGNGLRSPRSNTVSIAVTTYYLGFIPSTYT